MEILSSMVLAEHAEDISGSEKLKEALSSLIRGRKIEAISFRILFGGDSFKGPVLINKDFFPKFHKLVGLFPFYIPLAESLLKYFYNVYPDISMVAFFETSLFRSLPEEEESYALPDVYYREKNIKKWGFGGILHEYNSSVAGNSSKVISVILDKQTTVCPLDRGKPLSISLGYTPLEGVMGRTSCGDLDPGIIFYLMKRFNFSIFKIDDILKNKSGLLGLTGYDLDMKGLFTFYGRDNKVNLAFDIYQNQISRYIGEGMAIMSGLDAIVFSGSNLEFLMSLVYNLIKKISFLGISVEALPWGKKKGILKVTSQNSAIDIYFNYLNTSYIMAQDIKKYLP
jgi:acetate kinase